MENGADVLAKIAMAITSGDDHKARSILIEEYPLVPPSETERRAYSQRQALEVFIRDGFIDRYTGRKLVYPSVLYALADRFPDELPLGGGRKKSHSAHWDLFPTIDHLVPVAKGGQDAPSNWVTTSMTTNMAKSDTPLEILGWKVCEPGKLDEWDGLCSWYAEYIQQNPDAGTIRLNKGWHDAFVKRFL